MPLNDYDIKIDKWNSNGNWQFATKKGTHEEYFIKKYLEPTYPSLGNKETIESSKKIADQWFKYRNSINDHLKEVCDETGTLVTPIEFFNKDGIFYKITRKVVINDTYNEPEQIANLPLDTKLKMMKVISSALKLLHDVKFIHADIKRENILITTSNTGDITCNIIDFDSGFYENEPPFVKIIKDKKGERCEYEDAPTTPESNSPEVVRYNLGPNALGEDKPYRGYITKISCKSDIFSLGLVFHEYLTGKKINFDKYPSPAGKAIHEPLKVDESIPPYLSKLLECMLLCEPDKRPDIDRVLKVLRNCNENGEPYDPKITACGINGDDPEKTGKYAVKKIGAEGKVVYSLYENDEIKITIPKETYLEKHAGTYPLKSSEMRPGLRYAIKKIGAGGNVVYSLYENDEIKITIPKETYLEKYAGTYPAVRK